MTHNPNPNQSTLLSPEPIERKIGNTTYVVRTYFKPDAYEGLLDKLWRLMRNDGVPL